MGETPKIKSNGSINLEDHNLLNDYYANHFDPSTIFEFISRELFSQREFGFNRKDIGFTRNKSFQEPEYLKEYLSTFTTLGAYIGSIYSEQLMSSRQEEKSKTIHNTDWLGRELIFDLDMDEYDQVRTCDCVGKMVCQICWSLMQEAALIMDETLDVDFGFKNRKWVYTGGRGYHCWILDKKGITLTQEQRSAIIGYMQLIHDPKGLQKIDNIHQPNLLKMRIYEKIGRKFVLNATPKQLRDEVGLTDSKIKTLKANVQQKYRGSEIFQAIHESYESSLFSTIVKYHYPRIDHKVTIDIRRLIRMPNSIHSSKFDLCHLVDDPYNFNPLTDAINISHFIS